MAPSMLEGLHQANPTAVLALQAAAQPLPFELPAGATGVGLAIDDVRRWWPHLPAACWPSALAAAVPARRLAFAAGRLAAELALRSAGRPGPSGIGMGARREPLWPDGWRGAITHNDRWAGALVAPAVHLQGVGLDVERVVEGAGLAAIADACLTAAERARWLGGPEAAWRATLIFSAKEALYKALQPEGPAWVDFTDVEVLTVADGHLQLQAVPGTEVAGVLSGPVAVRWRRRHDEMHTLVLRQAPATPSA